MFWLFTMPSKLEKDCLGLLGSVPSYTTLEPYVLDSPPRAYVLFYMLFESNLGRFSTKYTLPRKTTEYLALLALF